ncbi:hypothetical protein CSKR_113921 [Clonorchis sinensis]|uniref:Uncharacterized protein n=2 Tax=Clonorchis sinensis TaxID=79923 RepID=G7YVV5_CLOSI|nr:hypothetical protein CSKR_113921 [Clonorchis sinensis]GAA57085.1 hypothetical protein CLF_112120 [Clonorchis sinensis]
MAIKGSFLEAFFGTNEKYIFAEHTDNINTCMKGMITDKVTQRVYSPTPGNCMLSLFAFVVLSPFKHSVIRTSIESTHEQLTLGVFTGQSVNHSQSTAFLLEVSVTSMKRSSDFTVKLYIVTLCKTYFECERGRNKWFGLVRSEISRSAFHAQCSGQVPEVNLTDIQSISQMIGNLLQSSVTPTTGNSELFTTDQKLWRNTALAFRTVIVIKLTQFLVDYRLPLFRIQHGTPSCSFEQTRIIWYKPSVQLRVPSVGLFYWNSFQRSLASFL